ncbi:MAG: hypothetical protein OXC30_03085 [Alphaproteobacteria bacterium]|nr:hypothetical protein [Alphaproteobacteria bacterium]
MKIIKNIITICAMIVVQAKSADLYNALEIGCDRKQVAQLALESLQDIMTDRDTWKTDRDTWKALQATALPGRPMSTRSHEIFSSDLSAAVSTLKDERGEMDLQHARDNHDARDNHELLRDCNQNLLKAMEWLQGRYHTYSTIRDFQEVGKKQILGMTDDKVELYIGLRKKIVRAAEDGHRTVIKWISERDQAIQQGQFERVVRFSSRLKNFDSVESVLQNVQEQLQEYADWQKIAMGSSSSLCEKQSEIELLCETFQNLCTKQSQCADIEATLLKGIAIKNSVCYKVTDIARSVWNCISGGDAEVPAYQARRKFNEYGVEISHAWDLRCDADDDANASEAPVTVLTDESEDESTHECRRRVRAE